MGYILHLGLLIVTISVKTAASGSDILNMYDVAEGKDVHTLIRINSPLDYMTDGNPSSYWLFHLTEDVRFYIDLLTIHSPRFIQIKLKGSHYLTIKGLTITVSNSRDGAHHKSHVCYKDLEYHQQIISCNTTLSSLPFSGRYVHIHIKKNKYVQYPTIKIQEIMIYDCIDGLYGQYGSGCTKNCSERHCSNLNDTCPSLSGACTNTCEDGWGFPDCTYKCAPDCEVCDFQTDSCLRCKNGLYGQSCHMNCQDRHCASNSSCDVTGACDNDGCQPGFSGSDCTINCHDYSIGCIQCNSTDCTNCSAGYYGNDCEKTCSPNCAPPGDGSIGSCDRVMGYCDQCLDGKYGHFCLDKCSSGCANKTCSQLDGHCDNGCLGGFVNQTCQSKCGDVCRNGICDELSGICSSCYAGWSGKKCDESDIESLISVDCLADKMVVIFDINGLLLIYNDSDAQSIVVGDSCRGSSLDKLLKFDVCYGCCSSKKMVVGSYEIVSNYISYEIGGLKGSPVTGERWRADLTCLVARSGNIDSSFLVHATDEHHSVSVYRPLPSVAFYSDSTFKTRQIFKVPVGDKIYVSVSIPKSNDTVMSVETCDAVPTGGSDGSQIYHLITSGCPASNTTSVILRDSSETRFSLTSFRFRHVTGFIDIHCDVKFCSSAEANQVCTPVC